MSVDLDTFRDCLQAAEFAWSAAWRGCGPGRVSPVQEPEPSWNEAVAEVPALSPEELESLRRAL